MHKLIDGDGRRSIEEDDEKSEEGVEVCLPLMGGEMACDPSKSNGSNSGVSVLYLKDRAESRDDID